MIRAEGGREGGRGRVWIYMLAVMHDSRRVFALQGAHPGDEAECVDRRAEGLVEGEFDRRVRLVQGFRRNGRFLFARTTSGGRRRWSGVAGEGLFEVLLPEEVWWAGEEGEEDEVQEGDGVEGEG